MKAVIPNDVITTWLQGLYPDTAARLFSDYDSIGMVNEKEDWDPTKWFCDMSEGLRDYFQDQFGIFLEEEGGEDVWIFTGRGPLTSIRMAQSLIGLIDNESNNNSGGPSPIADAVGAALFDDQGDYDTVYVECALTMLRVYLRENGWHKYTNPQVS